MKQVFSYLVIAVVTTVLISCGGDNYGKIMLTTETGDPFLKTFTLNLAGSGLATVDWGDGSKKVSLTLNGDDNQVSFSYDYPNRAIRTINIYGDDITQLECRNAISTSIDVSRCTELKKLVVMGDYTTLDISKNSALTELSSTGGLINLDLSNNIALTTVDVSSNQLTSIDVSKCTELLSLTCIGNQLTRLDVSNNPKLEFLDCASNQMTNLDVGMNTVLNTLDCTYNQLTNLDVNGCKALIILICFNNQLTNLDVSGCTALDRLYCGDNQLANLDVSDCTQLQMLNCTSNQLTTASLNALFSTLHSNLNFKLLNIYNNPGTNNCNRRIAENKNWLFES